MAMDNMQNAKKNLVGSDLLKEVNAKTKELSVLNDKVLSLVSNAEMITNAKRNEVLKCIQ